MANTTKPTVDKKELENAQNLWHTFTKWSKWGTIAIVIALALMALFLI